MQPAVSDQYIVEKWVEGWALSREVPAPVKHGSGFKVDVGWPQQAARYVFPVFTDEFIHLADEITEPWVFLKVCAPPDVMESLLPARWVIQPLGYMMTCFQPMVYRQVHLAPEYILEVQGDMPVFIVKVLTSAGDIAASGRLVVVDDFVIYDRIETAEQHRRKGLATIVLKALEDIAHTRGRTNAVLVATTAGRALYETLGWQLHAVFTSAVIPGI